MRVVRVRAPEGTGKQIADLAFEKGIAEVAINSSKRITADKKVSTVDVVEAETSTQKAKEFVEALTSAPFYHPKTFDFSVQHPESLFGTEPPSEETKPIIRPTVDVYEEFWQFSKVTVSLVMRVFLSSLLLSYGMVEGYMPLIIAGLLFLPYHHNLLGIGLGGSIREWRLLGQSFLAFLISTALIALAGICAALYLEPGIKFTEFSTPPLTSFLIAAVIGLAAGFGGIDDAGRRELIGLAATAHVSVYPAWFGLKFIYGFTEGDKPMEKLWVFAMDVGTIMVLSGLVFALMQMKGEGIRRFVGGIKKS